MFIFRVMPLEFINITKPLKLLVTTPTTAENGGTAEKIIPLSSTQTSQSCPCWCCHQQAEMFIFRVVQLEFINITNYPQVVGDNTNNGGKRRNGGKNYSPLFNPNFSILLYKWLRCISMSSAVFDTFQLFFSSLNLMYSRSAKSLYSWKFAN